MAPLTATATFQPLIRLSDLITATSQQVLWWQWLAVPGLLLASAALGYGLGRLAIAVVRAFTARTGTPWLAAMLRQVAWPLWGLLTLGIVWLGLPMLALVPRIEDLVSRGLQSGLLLVLFWGLASGFDVVYEVMGQTPWAQSHPAARALLPVARRILKVLVWVLAVLAVLADRGFPVASLLAGLGIGGLAFALAAQKTVEHLFGAVALGLDQPMRVGDLVRIEDFTGTVEAIGVRSTRIRTFDRTLISVPNGKLADMRIESFAARDRIRLHTTLHLVQASTPEQVRAVLTRLEALLRAHPLIWPDEVLVRLARLGPYALEVDVAAWFLCTWDEFTLVRQELLLQFLEVIRDAGTALALPSQTLHVAPEAAPRS